MGDYSHRMLNAFLGSELLPAFLRMRLMRRLGFDVSVDCCIWPGASLRSKRISIGSGVFINIGFFHDGYERLDIEDNVRIGQFVRVLTATHEIGPPHQRGLIEVSGRPVRIGKGSWIGSGVTILPGTTIAPGCVIAAGAVVVRSTRRDCVYAGVPARVVKELDDTRPATVADAVATERLEAPVG